LGVATYQWIHIIDSKDSKAPDIGTCPNSASGDFLETGKAPHPKTNIVTEYEEVWHPLSIPSAKTIPYAWILQSEDGATFLGKVGGVFQAMRADRDKLGKQKSFCARRELWDVEQEAWIIKYEVGDAESLRALPSLASGKNGEILAWESSSSEGDMVDVFGARFVVRAISNIT
jgi:hypothetical protein